jgi:glucokinase
VSALLPDGQVVESEGGHISFAPQSELQQQLLTALWSLFPRLSVERLISGPGLANLYRGLGLIRGEDQQLLPEQITRGALAGDGHCREAVEMFSQLFGSVCGDLALALGAKGGVYLSGGLLQALGGQFDDQEFLRHFSDKGRYSDYCRQIPVARVSCSQPGLLGAARFARLQSRNTG